jgi:hypothetical protein
VYTACAKRSCALLQDRCCTVLKCESPSHTTFLVANVTTVTCLWGSLTAPIVKVCIVSLVTLELYPINDRCHILVEVTPNTYCNRKCRIFTVTSTIKYILFLTEEQGLLDYPVVTCTSRLTGKTACNHHKCQSANAV